MPIISDYFIHVNHHRFEHPQPLKENDTKVPALVSAVTVVRVYNLEDFKACDKDANRTFAEVKPVAIGACACSAKDAFCRRTGVTIAGNRALGKLGKSLNFVHGTGWVIEDRPDVKERSHNYTTSDLAYELVQD